MTTVMSQVEFLERNTSIGVDTGRILRRLQTPRKQEANNVVVTCTQPGDELLSAWSTKGPSALWALVLGDGTGGISGHLVSQGAASEGGGGGDRLACGSPSLVRC